MTYYTPEFKQEFAHPEEEIKSYIATGNQVFKNSGMNIELKYFDCSFEEIDIWDEGKVQVVQDWVISRRQKDLKASCLNLMTLPC